MIGYITLGTNDFDNAIKFYDALFLEIGAKRFMETERFVAWSKNPGEPAISVTKPFNKEKATVGNGSMVAIMLESPEEVDRMYEKAIQLGATDDGKPGKRGDGGFYAAYFRDLDGNKINFFNMAM